MFDGPGNSKLISVSQLDKDFRTLFKFTNFNSVQSQCFKEIFDSDINMVISAPTGAGKTVSGAVVLRVVISHFFLKVSKITKSYS